MLAWVKTTYDHWLTRGYGTGQGVISQALETPEEKAKRINVPLIPKRPRTPWKKPVPDTNPTTSVCGECGIEIKRIMYFVCSNTRCPVQQRPTYDTHNNRS